MSIPKKQKVAAFVEVALLSHGQLLNNHSRIVLCTDSRHTTGLSKHFPIIWASELAHLQGIPHGWSRFGIVWFPPEAPATCNTHSPGEGDPEGRSPFERTSRRNKPNLQVTRFGVPQKSCSKEVELQSMNVSSSFGPTFAAQLAAWKSGIVLDVVDHSLEQSRKTREEAKVRESERAAQAQQAAESQARTKTDRARIEEDDARRLAELEQARARDAQRRELLAQE